MLSVYRLTLRQLAGKWRLVIMTVLAIMPVLMTLLALLDDHAPSVGEFEAIVLSGMLAGSIVPLVVLAIASVAFGNEVEDRTLANLTSSPLPRWQIAVPKFLATVTVAGPFIGLSAFTVSYLAFLGDARAVTAVTVAAVVGVAMYAAVFVWLGLVSNYAIGIGLLYIVLWEGLFARFVRGVKLLSIREYATALMHGLDERRFADADHLNLWVTLLLVAAVIGGSLWLATRKLRTMDVP